MAAGAPSQKRFIGKIPLQMAAKQKLIFYNMQIFYL
jgi:hypothetical protein